MSLLVIGSVAFDAIETPFGKTDKIIGGAATYISLAASYSIKPVNLVAVVGDDFPATDISLLQQHGVDTTGLQIKAGEKSFFWSGRYNRDLNSRDTLVTELNVLGSFDPVIPAAYQQTDFLMLGNLVPAVQRTVIERLRRRPKLIVMDTMNFWMDTAMDDLRQTLGMVDVLSINDEEARQLSGEYSLIKAARAIRAMGPHTLIIKKGEHGALLFGADSQIFYCPALPLEDVFDRCRRHLRGGLHWLPGRCQPHRLRRNDPRRGARLGAGVVLRREIRPGAFAQPERRRNPRS
jgi:sugar/nucleoside kinase (ribokinase family)